ncbi:hypothetical protein BH11MYX4_BH11MYX4_69640 [soil metagenome]
MKRALFLFVTLFVTACSGRIDGGGSGGMWGDPSSDASAPWGGDEPSAPDASVGDPWTDGGSTEPPWADASVDPDGGVDPWSDGGVEPADASPDSPPCHGDPPLPVDASVPEPDAG